MGRTFEFWMKLILWMDSLLYDPEAERVGTGVHADGGADLVEGDFFYIITFLTQYRQRLIAKCGSLFHVIAVSYRDAVAFTWKTAFPQIFQKKIHNLLERALPSSVDTGGEDLAFF